MAVANIFILALTITIWEVNSQKCGGSILVNPLRPPLEEESPIFANPLRPSFAKNPSFPKVSLPMANKLPITGMTLSELTTPRFKAPSFSATCVSSESLLPLTVKTNLSSTALDEIDNSQSLLSNSGQDIIIPLSSEKPIKFYGPLNVEMNNLPLIKPNFALPCDTVSNLVDIEPPILPNLIANSNPVSLFNKTPMTTLIPTTRGLKYILDSSNNISPHYKTFQSSQSKPSAESVASATSSISPSLGQSSSSASTINVNYFQPNQVHQSPYSSNIFNCPENDPTCSFTSVPPLAPCDLPALNDADSSSLITSTSAASLMSSGQVNPNLVYPYISNLTPALYQPSTSMQSSSTAFSSGNAQLNPYQLNPFSSHIYGCPEIDPICFHTSVPPLSTNLSYQPSVNVAEATSAVSTGPKQASSSSSSSVNVDSYNYGQVNSVLPSSYLSYRLPSSSQSSVNVAESTTSVASGSTKASSLTSSSTDFSQINSNLVDPFSSYMSACPEADPTYSYTSVPPLSTAPCYQSSENVAKATSSVSTGPTQASASSSTINVDSYNTGPVNSVFSSPYLSHSLSSPSQSSVNIAESTTSRASGLRQGSSSSSAYLLSDNSQIAPFSPYIYGCPVSDPTYSHTSIAPLPTTSVAHSFVDVAQTTSSGSPSLEQAVFSSSSLNLNPYNTPANSILFTPYSNYVNTGAVTAPSQSSTSIAKTKNTVVAGLGQASSAASSGNIATGPFSPSSYLLNTIACPDTDSTCSFTSVQPVSADQSSVKADSYSSNVFGSPVQYSSNVVEAKSSFSSSTGQDYSSTSFVNNDEITSRRDSPSTYNSNVFSCPNTDLTCSFFSVPPVSEVPTYQSSVNVAESSSLTTSDQKSLSSSSFGANQVILNTAKPNLINIAGFPDFGPACLYTSVNPVASNKMNQPSVGISEASSVARASSSASSISVNSFASEDIDSTPNQSNTYNCPDTDPTCSFTSVPPVSEALPYQSSNLGSLSSSSFVANQVSSNTLNPYSTNIEGCPGFDPTCSFTSVKPVPPTAFYQPSVGLAEISSATSSESGHISPLSSPYLNPTVIEQASPSLSTFSSMPQFVTSTPQSTVSSVETASSISSNSVQTEVSTFSTTSSTNLDAPSTTLNNDNINNLPGIYSASSTETSVPKITSSSSVSKTVSASSNTPSAPAAVDNHIGVPQNTLTSVVENTAASFTDSSSPINILTASSSSSTTTTDVNSLADKSVPQLLLNNPLSVVEISSSSSTISSPTKVLTDSPSISITSADTTSLVDQSPTSLSGQKTQVSKSATSLLSTPTSISMPLPSTYPSKLALSMSAPEFNLGINPLTLKVEIPSTIMSSIVTSNVPRAYGPHSIKIPSYIPAQLSCTLRS